MAGQPQSPLIPCFYLPDFQDHQDPKHPAYWFFKHHHNIYVVESQFVIQTYNAMAQWAQDNKFVVGGLEYWALVNSGYNYHKFRDDLNETSKTKLEKILSPRSFSFLVDWSFLHTILDKLVILLFLDFSSPFHKRLFTLYSSLWIILTLHLSIIWDFIWVLVPSDTSPGFLWVVVTRVSLFRCLLHINATKKVVTVNLMP